jgi:predicted PurR-regulated permease PerM
VVCRLFAPFFTAFLWSTLLYILINPLYRRVVRKPDTSKIRGPIIKSLWAAVFALGTVIIIIVPCFWLASQFLRQIMELFRFARDAFNTNPLILYEFFQKISDLISTFTWDQIYISAEEIQAWIVTLLSSSIQNLIHLSGTVALNMGFVLFNLVCMIFCLFFFYLDGAYLAGLVLRAIPIRKEYISALVSKFTDITKNLFLGYIMVSLVQTVLAYIIFLIFQVKGALVFAALVFICVFIPMIGGGIVWLPLGIVRILQGDTLGGIVFLLVSGFFISTLDNFLRPLFLHNRIQLHPLLIFFAILGGIRAFGFNGLVLGPMAVILFLTVLDMFLTEHKIEQD